MRVGGDVAEPLVERLVVELRKSRGPAACLFGGDPFNARFDLAPRVGVLWIEASPVLLQVVVGQKLCANSVGELNNFDAVGGDVLGARVEPDTVGLRQRARASAHVAGRIEHMQVL